MLRYEVTGLPNSLGEGYSFREGRMKCHLPTVSGQVTWKQGRGKTLLFNHRHSHVKYFTNPNSQRENADHRRLRSLPITQSLSDSLTIKGFLHQGVKTRKDSALPSQRYSTVLLLESLVVKSGMRFLIFLPCQERILKRHQISDHTQDTSNDLAKLFPVHWPTLK